MARSPELGSQDIALAVRETREWLEVSIASCTRCFKRPSICRTGCSVTRVLFSVLPAAGGDGAAFPGRPLFPCGPGGRRAAVRVSLCNLHAVRQRATTSLLHVHYRLMEKLSPGSIRKINRSPSPIAYLVRPPALVSPLKAYHSYSFVCSGQYSAVSYELQGPGPEGRPAL